MNLKRVNAVIDSIDPDRLDMFTWARRDPEGRVTMCLAGWTCAHMGDPPVFRFDQLTSFTTASGRDIKEQAARYLELHGRETVDLFCAFTARTPEDLRSVARRIHAYGAPTFAMSL